MKSLLARLVAGVFAAILLAPSVARADDVSDLKAKVVTAMASVSSFQMQLTSPYGAAGQFTIVARPAMMAKALIAAGPMTIEQYLADGFSYMLVNGAWQKRSIPLAQVAALVQMINKDTPMTLAPDRTEDGIVYGALSATARTPIPFPGAPPNISLACTYDKKTYLVHRCFNELATLTYVGYNDPANVVVIPDAAKNAPELPPFQLPQPMPAPSTLP